MNEQDRFRQLHGKVNNLTFSEISIHQLLDLVNEACAYSPPLGKRPEIAAQFQQIRDEQIRPMLEEEMPLKEIRQRFYASKRNLEQHLKQCLALNGAKTDHRDRP